MTDFAAELRAVQSSLNYQARRHEVISANIANAQTPAYRAKDLAFHIELDRRLPVQRTHRDHMTPNSAGSPAAGAGRSNEAGRSLFATIEDNTAPSRVDGNNVSVESQMAKMAANSIRYRALIEMMSRRMALIRYAATDGQRR